MWIQPSSESSYVTSCHPIGTSSLKIKCMRKMGDLLRNGQSLHTLNKSLPGWSSKDNFCVVQLLPATLYSQLCGVRTFRMFSCLRCSDWHGPCMGHLSSTMGSHIVQPCCFWNFKKMTLQIYVEGILFLFGSWLTSNVCFFALLRLMKFIFILPSIFFWSLVRMLHILLLIAWWQVPKVMDWKILLNCIVSMQHSMATY